MRFFLLRLLKSFFPFLFPSRIRPLTGMQELALQHVGVRGHRGRFQFFGRSNGRSRRRKSNRLHLSTRTRNKNR